MKINKNLWFLIIPIFCIALITGSFFYTRGIIKANEAAKANGVIADVFPDAVRYSEATYNKRFLALYLEEQGYETTDVVVDHVVYARNEQNAVKGLIVYVNCYKKFGGLIQMAVGIQNNGTINGYTILDISDAKGLESKVKDDDFKNQFIGKNVSAFVLSDEPHNDAEIEAPNG
ncbi:MAG: hypothetical protein IKR99_03400, partial [Lachnospiraceae bacterium]|nr:hypothetical protein [Lachnospiraceae bacterium]